MITKHGKKPYISTDFTTVGEDTWKSRSSMYHLRLYKGSLCHPCKDFAVFIDYSWLILRNQQSMACKEITIKVTRYLVGYS